MTELSASPDDSPLDDDVPEAEEPRAVFERGQSLGGRYVIEELIKRGGMGEVYAARHEQLGKRVAIKTLRSDSAPAGARRRFEREARVLASLENEHIVSAFDFGKCDDGRMFLVMEHLAGQDLRSLLRAERSLVAPRAVGLMLQVCRGLAAAHRAGAVHRDLKPENIVVCRRDDGSELCKILDFGLVKLREPGESSLRTRTGMALGTISYMSPEQARGEREVDHRSDIYSVAAVLYELLSGQRPHDAESALALINKIVSEPPRQLRDLCELPRGLSEVVHRALEPRPGDRYAWITDFERALRPYAVRGVVVESQAATISIEAPSPLVRTARSRLRGLAWLGVAAALPLIVIALGLVTHAAPLAGSAPTRVAASELGGPGVAASLAAPVSTSPAAPPSQPSMAPAPTASPAPPTPLATSTARPNPRVQPRRAASPLTSAAPAAESEPGADSSFDRNNPYKNRSQTSP